MNKMGRSLWNYINGTYEWSLDIKSKLENDRMLMELFHLI